jgi:hypothetical protein
MLGEELAPLPPEAAATNAVAGAASMVERKRVRRVRETAIFTLHPMEEKMGSD